MIDSIMKYKFVLPIVLVIFIFTSCQKGGEPIPMITGDTTYVDDATDVDENIDNAQRLGDPSGGGDSDDPGTGGGGVVGGDDNEDDDVNLDGGGGANGDNSGGDQDPGTSGSGG